MVEVLGVVGRVLVERECSATWLIRPDVWFDPRLVAGHSGVDSRQIGPSTAKTKTNNSRLDPHVALFADHWTSRVTLGKWSGGISGCQMIQNTSLQMPQFSGTHYLTRVFSSCQTTCTHHVVCDCTNSVQTVTLPVSHNRNFHFLQRLREW